MKEFTKAEYSKIWNFLREEMFCEKVPDQKLIPFPTSISVIDAEDNSECGRFYIDRDTDSAGLSVYKGTRLEEVMAGSQWKDMFKSESKPRAFDRQGYPIY